jgi:KipI family sensor histidine kinase inhibitor
MKKEKILASGDCSILIKFGDEIKEETSKRINKFNKILKACNQKAVIDTIPSYCALLVNYRPELIRFKELVNYLIDLSQNIDEELELDKEIIEIPVLYGKSKGIDIEAVAHHNGLSIEEVISLHSEPEYLIYMLGFTPGFPYLGGMNKKIATPRLETPRVKIEAGSVGIAGEQTGIYPISSPGGWQLIGQTPIELFNIDKKDPILLKAGQYIKFKVIDQDEFDKIKAKNEENNLKQSNIDDYNYQGKRGFIVRNQGLLTTIQDMGRYQYQAFGVPVSGAMDTYSLSLANILVDNDIGEAVLETTILGPTLEFTEDNIIAITGADLMPCVNGIDVSMNTAFLCHKGDILSFKGAVSGSRAYIAFAGGLAVPKVMGSKSTYIKARIGGYKGRRLEKNDELGFENPKLNIENLASRKININDQADNQISKKAIKLRVVMGPQEEHFTECGIKTFLNSTYTVSNEFDRMGCRLEGEKIQHIKDGNIISDGIAFGAIQVPSHGTPIIMLADRQTVGGYAKIANVISVDLPKIAQARAGDKIIFEKISVEDAQSLYIEQLAEFEKIKMSFSQINKHNESNLKDHNPNELQSISKYYQVKVNNKIYNVEISEIS